MDMLLYLLCLDHHGTSKSDNRFVELTKYIPAL